MLTDFQAILAAARTAEISALSAATAMDYLRRQHPEQRSDFVDWVRDGMFSYYLDHWYGATDFPSYVDAEVMLVAECILLAIESGTVREPTIEYFIERLDPLVSDVARKASDPFPSVLPKFGDVPDLPPTIPIADRIALLRNACERSIGSGSQTATLLAKIIPENASLSDLELLMRERFDRLKYFWYWFPGSGSMRDRILSEASADLMLAAWNDAAAALQDEGIGKGP